MTALKSWIECCTGRTSSRHGWPPTFGGKASLQMQWIGTTAVLLVTSLLVLADERESLKEVHLDPTSSDIVGQFHQMGFPKYTDVEKRIIGRAQKVQDERTAMYGRIEIGKSVFDYPGLIALGTIRYESGDGATTR